MNSNLFKAILAMDSYNRGYNAGIDLRKKNATGQYIQDSDTTYTENSVTYRAQLGNAIIYDKKGDTAAQSIGFYGIAYDLDGLPGGETVISYRGTDDFNGNPLTSNDAKHGWTLGLTNTDSQQGRMAVQFYQAVAGSGNWLSANISLTGHSLGGGLAANDNQQQMKKRAA